MSTILVGAGEKIRAAIRELLRRREPSGIISDKTFSEPSHLVRFRPNKGAPIVGPSILPRSEQHHESRQASAQYLRARMFESVSRDAPRMSRKDRRRLAKQFARNEYRRMMADDTNAGEAAS